MVTRSSKPLLVFAAAFLLPTIVIAQKANTVFLNGTIYTMDATRPAAEAMAISGQQISFVGSDDGVQSLIREGTTVIDLQGKMVLPGFVSGHEHLVASG
ncbi:hypothetical protein [Ruegeria atlantica]|uniref:N-substituted formamide deformylase n=1 Tax=Ruegeria atlantica TaxID=81569 RepID=A0A0P1EKN0_9RHOB|nr:hypothetical protein [Ruegeria atlantica]CUH41986.1 N-substituted formamide deformylase precursor [Ruegeria atlantica]